jgi:dynein heavy chain
MDKYIPSCLEVIRTRFKTILPIPEICHLQMLCRLLDCLLTPAIMTSENPRELFELYFVFACVWAFGSALPGDLNCNQRADFSTWWVSEFKAVRFPVAFGCPTVFDFCIDTELQTLVPWTERVPKFDPDPDLPIYTTLVPTAQSTCLRYFLDLLMRAGQPILLVGASGSGKTALVEEALGSLSEEYITRAVPMHYYMTSEMLQGVLENSLEKKAGRSYGPPGTKHIIYFLDDFNAPHMDIYGTAQAHTLLRQHLSYGHW